MGVLRDHPRGDRPAASRPGVSQPRARRLSQHDLRDIRARLRGTSYECVEPQAGIGGDLDLEVDPTDITLQTLPLWLLLVLSALAAGANYS